MVSSPSAQLPTHSAVLRGYGRAKQQRFYRRPGVQRGFFNGNESPVGNGLPIPQSPDNIDTLFQAGIPVGFGRAIYPR